MELILWRHAEADDERPGQGDLQRALTPRGEKQAAKMARWLEPQLPESALILCSPALRCEQTVLPLGRKYELCDGLAPDNTSKLLLQAAGWPDALRTVLVVGHQPTLGEAIAMLVGTQGANVQVRKGSVWRLRTRQRNGDQQTVVIAVQSPDLL